MFKNPMFITIDNLSLLKILPFGTGYCLMKDGKPCEDSLAVAMLFQALQAVKNPHTAVRTWTN